MRHRISGRCSARAEAAEGARFNRRKLRIRHDTTLREPKGLRATGSGGSNTHRRAFASGQTFPAHPERRSDCAAAGAGGAPRTPLNSCRRARRAREGARRSRTASGHHWSWRCGRGSVLPTPRDLIPARDRFLSQGNGVGQVDPLRGLSFAFVDAGRFLQS